MLCIGKKNFEGRCVADDGKCRVDGCGCVNKDLLCGICKEMFAERHIDEYCALLLPQMHKST